MNGYSNYYLINLNFNRLNIIDNIYYLIIISILTDVNLKKLVIYFAIALAICSDAKRFISLYDSNIDIRRAVLLLKAVLNNEAEKNVLKKLHNI
jgi:hypothetical protein